MQVHYALTRKREGDGYSGFEGYHVLAQGLRGGFVSMPRLRGHWLWRNRLAGRARVRTPVFYAASHLEFDHPYF